MIVSTYFKHFFGAVALVVRGLNLVITQLMWTQKLQTPVDWKFHPHSPVLNPWRTHDRGMFGRWTVGFDRPADDA
jgi:hypothetical protein